MLKLGVDGVLNAFVVAVEVVELVPNLIQVAQVRWIALALGHQIRFVALDHRPQAFRARAIARKLLIISYRRPCGLHIASFRFRAIS